jgi:hypothetical protein
VDVTVNCKVGRSAIALHLSVDPRCVYKVSINPIIQYIAHIIVIPTCDNINAHILHNKKDRKHSTRAVI